MSSDAPLDALGPLVAAYATHIATVAAFTTEEGAKPQGLPAAAPLRCVDDGLVAGLPCVAPTTPEAPAVVVPSVPSLPGDTAVPRCNPPGAVADALLSGKALAASPGF